MKPKPGLLGRVAGFTGTGHAPGMTEAQRTSFTQLMIRLRPLTFHHGDCVNADAQAHKLIRHLHTNTSIHVHPPSDPKARAFCVGHVMWDKKPYRKRNQDIVDRCDYLVATPRQFQEVLRSGTWMTIRMAKRAGKPIYYIWPDGTVEEPDVEPKRP